MPETPPSTAETKINHELSAMLKKSNVDVPAAKSGAIADQIVEAVKKSDTIALAQIESPFLSTINITQLIGGLLAILTLFGIPVPDDVRSALMGGIVGLMVVVTWVLKTFFSGKVTWASAQV